MCVSGRLSVGLIRWTGKYDNVSFRIKTPFSGVSDHSRENSINNKKNETKLNSIA